MTPQLMGLSSEPLEAPSALAANRIRLVSAGFGLVASPLRRCRSVWQHSLISK
jgi:hypothetical protein